MSFGTLDFAHPWALLGVLAAAPAVWLLLERRRRVPRLVMPSSAAARAIQPSRWARLWWLPGALVIAAIFLTSIGLAGPRLRASRRQDMSVEGIDIVVAFDLSTSMLAADFRPKDRITVAKEVLKNFIESRQNDRIGLVVFAGEAYTQCPLTLDYKVLEELLEQVRTNGGRGTGVPDEIAEALSARELEVLLLLDDHLGTDEIAKRLFISEHTVRSHVKSLLRKLGVSSRREALEALSVARR